MDFSEWPHMCDMDRTLGSLCFERAITNWPDASWGQLAMATSRIYSAMGAYTSAGMTVTEQAECIKKIVLGKEPLPPFGEKAR